MAKTYDEQMQSYDEQMKKLRKKKNELKRKQQEDELKKKASMYDDIFEWMNGNTINNGEGMSVTVWEWYNETSR